MRHDHQARFCVTQVHDDHVQIIDEQKQAKWFVWTHTDPYLTSLQELCVAVTNAQTALDECGKMHQQNPCNQSKSNMQNAARKLGKAQQALATFQTPDYYYDIYYDSIFSLQFAADNGICVMY